MFAILAHIRPLDPRTGNRVDVRVASTPGAAYQGLGRVVWESAIIKRPKASIELFSPDLTGGLRTAEAEFDISLNAIAEVSTVGLDWSGAPVVIYRADRLAWPAPVEFEGIVTDPKPQIDTGRLTLKCKVDAEAFDKPLLVSEFTGGGGLNGDPDMRGVLKPAGFGNCLNVPVLFFDNVRNIGMVDGYGNLISVSWLAEGLSTLGASKGDFADYAALAAAIDAKVIGPGQWGTCIASGLIGLGAPPVGVITAHCLFGYGMTGAMMRRVLLIHAAVPAGRLEDGSFTALDTALPFAAHYWTADQIQVKQLVEMLAAGCNASPVVTFQNRLTIIRPFGGVSIGLLKRDGFSEPAVNNWQAGETLIPYWRVKGRTARPVKVLTREEVNYADTFVPRGVFDPAETYRQGNTVWTADGAEWLYINEAAQAGHIPPTETNEDEWWQRLRPPTNEQIADAYRDAVEIVPGDIYKKGYIGLNQGARWIYTADIVWDNTMPPALPAESNAFWTLLRDASVVSITSNTPSFAVQADYASKPLDGQLPVSGRGILKVGTVDISASVTWSVVPSGCDATIAASGVFTITAMRTSGYVDVVAAYAGKNYVVRVTTTLNVAAPPASGGSGGGGGGGTPGSSAYVTTFPTVNSTTYPAAPSATATVTAATGHLALSASLSYSIAYFSGPGDRSINVYGKLVYRVSGSGSGWTDAAAETAGQPAIRYGSDGGNYNEAPVYADGEFTGQDGYLEIPAIDVTGLVAGGVYEFGILLRKVGYGSTTPYGSVTGVGS